MSDMITRRIINDYSWAAQTWFHINHLELLAVLNCFKWRLRKIAQVGCRFLHLVDNQLVAAVLSRGRSSSSKLRHSLKRLNALVLAACVYPCFGFVDSEDNPSDIPSRWASKEKRKSN